MEGGNEWIGKKVFIKTISGRRYSGIVLEKDDRICTILDKFGMRVEFRSDALEVLEEWRDNEIRE